MVLSESQIKAIKAAVGYKGRKVTIQPFVPMCLNSYWDSGSRDYFFFMSPNGQMLRSVPQNGTPFDRLNLSVDKLDNGEVLVKNTIFRGKDLGLKIFVPNA